MHIHPLFLPLDEILNIGFFFVPRFQRPYSWDEQQIEEFWQDCIVDQAEAEYFIGSLVLFKEGSRYGIVDGQQRMTTVTMILCALRNALREQRHDDAADGLNNKFIMRPNLENKPQAVLSSQSSIPYFQSVIQKLPGTHDEVAKTSEEKRIEHSFNFIKAKIDAVVAEVIIPASSEAKRRTAIRKRLLQIRDRLLSLKAMALTLDNDVDAYIIFETLNTRGKDLELSDLVRTHLTKCLPQGNNTTDQVRSKFDALRLSFDACGRKLDEFILHFWLSRYKYTAKRKIYKELRNNVKKAKAGVFLDELLQDGERYLDILIRA